MGKRLLNIEKIQDEHCDHTRGTNKRFRVLRNIGEAARYFPVGEPVLCFGSGDGFEIEIWRLLGYEAIGCEISENKRNIAKQYGMISFRDTMGIPKHNVYCAHTIEHLADRDKIIKELFDISISTTCFIFPIEPDGSKNPSHLSPVKLLSDIQAEGEVLLKTERWNDEREGIIICKKNYPGRAVPPA